MIHLLLHGHRAEWLLCYYGLPAGVAEDRGIRAHRFCRRCVR